MADPVIVTLKVPLVALRLAVKVSVEEHVGVQWLGEKEAVTPAGSPDVVKLTFWPVPETSVAVTVVVVVEPWATVPLEGEAERLKLKAGAITGKRIGTVSCDKEPLVPVTVTV